MAIPNPNPNIADGIKSDNKTYSSNKIESLIKTATELPIPEEGDAGKVLTVNSDSDGYELDVIPSELPTPEAGDEGKVLTVNAAEDGYELTSLPTPDTEALTATLVADLSSVTIVNAYYREGILFVNGRLASTTGISAGGEIFTISGYNTIDTNDYFIVVGVSSTGSGSYGYTENTSSGIKFSIGTAALASDNQFFFSIALPVTKL